MLSDWQISHPAASVKLIGENAEPNLNDPGVDFRISYGGLITRFDHWSELFTDWAVPVCSPELLNMRSLLQPSDILTSPLLGIEWAREQGTASGWADWAAQIGAPPPGTAGVLVFSLSSAAIDAAINGRGFVLAQLSMVKDDIAAGRLVVPFDVKVKLSQPYALAWSSAALTKPFGLELLQWIKAIARKLGTTP